METHDQGLEMKELPKVHKLGDEVEVVIEAKEKHKKHKKKDKPPHKEEVVAQEVAVVAETKKEDHSEDEKGKEKDHHDHNKASEKKKEEEASEGHRKKEQHGASHEFSAKEEEESDEREKEMSEAKQKLIEEKARSLRNSSQTVGVAIKKAIQFTVASASMLKDDDDLEEEHFTDQVVYHTSKALSAMLITDYSPLAFHRIRTLAGVTPQEYLGAWLNTPLDEGKLFKKAASGKSGSLFLFSANGQFIMKTLPSKEGKALIKMLPNYYQHIRDNPQSLLCRLLGYYAIEVGGHTHYLVMQRNIFWNAPPFSEIFDLKGSTRGRRSTEEERKRGGNKCVLKDLDFIDAKRKISLPQAIKEKFIEVVKRDSEFLVPSNLIDYSLLVGIHKKEKADNHEDEHHVRGKHHKTDKKDKKKSKKKKKHKEDEILNAHSDHEKEETKHDDDFFLWKGGVESADKSEVYYMGIIDFLSPYATKKKMAHLFKRGVLLNDAAVLSLVPADYYASRFQQFLGAGLTGDDNGPVDE